MSMSPLEIEVRTALSDVVTLEQTENENAKDTDVLYLLREVGNRVQGRVDEAVAKSQQETFNWQENLDVLNALSQGYDNYCAGGNFSDAYAAVVKINGFEDIGAPSLGGEDKYKPGENTPKAPGEKDPLDPADPADGGADPADPAEPEKKKLFERIKLPNLGGFSMAGKGKYIALVAALGLVGVGVGDCGGVRSKAWSGISSLWSDDYKKSDLKKAMAKLRTDEHGIQMERISPLLAKLGSLQGSDYSSKKLSVDADEDSQGSLKARGDSVVDYLTQAIRLHCNSKIDGSRLDAILGMGVEDISDAVKEDIKPYEHIKCGASRGPAEKPELDNTKREFLEGKAKSYSAKIQSKLKGHRSYLEKTTKHKLADFDLAVRKDDTVATLEMRFQQYEKMITGFTAAIRCGASDAIRSRTANQLYGALGMTANAIATTYSTSGLSAYADARCGKSSAVIRVRTPKPKTIRRSSRRLSGAGAERIRSNTGGANRVSDKPYRTGSAGRYVNPSR